MTNPHPLIEAHDLTVSYQEAVALDRVNFCIAAGDYVAIIGPNGAGKSTLLKTIMGMIAPLHGQMVVHAAARRIGYVPQHEAVNLDFPVTVRDVVMMGRLPQLGWLRMPGRRDRAAVADAMARVGLSELGDRQIGALSGGQRRRAFIARALAQEASLLLLDEPMTGVDVTGQADLMAVLDTLHGQGLTIVMTTHDLDLAFRRFPKVMALRNALIAFGPPEAVRTPQVLARVYDRIITTNMDGEPAALLIDEHGCESC